MKRIGHHTALPIAALAVTLLGCEVKNPGAILDPDLDNEIVMQALVTGMSSDFSEGFDDIAFVIARGTDETTGSGSYGLTGLLRRGIVERDDINGQWADAQRARWVAEQGLTRMQEVMGSTFTGSKLTARAYFLAGLANRVLGECFCQVTFDGGGAEVNTAAFQRAIPHLQAAISHATQFLQTTPTDTAMLNLVTASHGVLAQAYVGLGDWTNAAAEAALVTSNTFVYNAPYSSNSGREQNIIYVETNNRTEFSTFGSYVGSLGPSGDPRTLWINANRLGADGVTPHWRQRKYLDLGGDIPVVKGTEMRLVQAEVRLVANDASSVTDAMAFINQVRARHSLSNLSASNAQQAWTHLDRERLLTLWLEGRRYFDLRRWDAAGNLSFLPSVQYVYGLTTAVYSKDPNIPKRATCIPISENECNTNPALAGQCQ